jgi:hypothetical protein
VPGESIDEAALHGIISLFADLRLTLQHVTCIPPNT